MSDQKLINIQDAQILEDDEQLQFRHRRTRHAISQTYGEKSPTKKRRKLVGRNGKPRKWKNKQKQYAPVIGEMTKDAFNSRTRRDKALARIYKRQEKFRMIDSD